MMSAQPFERGNHFRLVLVHRIGDHTRGLFEAEASPMVSAVHPLEDVEIVFFVGH